MWKACLRVVKEQANQAKHVLDRFHIVQKLGKAIDKVRAAEAKQLNAQGKDPVLKSSRWLLLKRPERLTEKQEPKLAELLQLNLRTVRACLLKEDFQLLWDCRSPTQASKFLKRWCRRATRSAHPAHAEGGEDAAPAPAAGAELVPHRAGLLLRHGGRDEQQSQGQPQESVRIPLP